ncbi:hypothetical protein FB45DRAFT_879297 [Roridomyces roridus]|uniref:Uncharacterized protein n=1 Tax=Roridomyces roridus TaxID=1738132 RepID=A0AAD7AZM3_9AGAR|nr:hypothetical protein FB45DRAFT_879297 [Roridomyces roridus]
MLISGDTGSWQSEPLDLNGDAYEDLVNGHIESLSMDRGEAFRAMYMATKPKLLSHAKFWDRAAFVEECGEFIISHELNDGTYRPATYGRVAPPETRRPRIAVVISSDETSKRTSRNRTRRRAEDEGTDEDAPPAKRPAQSNRELRPRNQGVVVYAPVVPPAPPVDEAKITGRGRGHWSVVQVEHRDLDAQGPERITSTVTEVIMQLVRCCLGDKKVTRRSYMGHEWQSSGGGALRFAEAELSGWTDRMAEVQAKIVEIIFSPGGEAARLSWAKAKREELNCECRKPGGDGRMQIDTGGGRGWGAYTVYMADGEAGGAAKGRKGHSGSQAVDFEVK